MIYPMRFVLPHVRGIRPWWVVRLGLLLYDRIGGKSRLPGSRGLRPWDRRFQAPLQRTRAGFVYSDCVVDDSRSEEHTSELQSLTRISYAVLCLKKQTKKTDQKTS